MMALTDPSQNMDKYFVLQWIETKQQQHVVYSRWGRTGSKGQGQVQTFKDPVKAQVAFESKFLQKTALEWSERDQDPVPGKYRFVTQDFGEKEDGYKNATWQYWVDDGVDGKKTGWYDYDEDASVKVERLFHEHAQNKSMSTRHVDSGVYTYEVDLSVMTQTNIKVANRTTRHIRRCPKGSKANNNPPAALQAKIAPATPNRKKKAAAVVTPSPPSAPAKPSKTPAKSSSAAPPVDTDISVTGTDAADYEVVQNPAGLWCDAVLNQCNINWNNNKYYRLQCLQHKAGGFYAWFRWGRVGEATRVSSTTLSGPHPNKMAAYKEFTKKFQSKTGNAFGTANFVPKTGKYDLIEIDNDVEVSEDYKVSAVNEDLQYEESVLDAKTKELIEVLFSEDMRNEALSSFNLDLKRLPLGVPSQDQIQHGIDILEEIENKINSKHGSSSESFQDLSSTFYTAIPHSFGRSAPPVIKTQDAVQSRFDMCNILLDMYDTNETIREIQKKDAKKTTTLLPNQIDQHYESLQARLELLDKKSKEYKAISTFFEKTKSSGRNSKLLNIWSMDRHHESKRFAKYDKLDNRCLLWHGTNIAVVAPIITSGLRIMPHSGGRVGAGIYLANMQEKSSCYTSGYEAKFACMFLCEAPLGKQHEVTSDGSHASGLKKAPQGSDSVHAVGRIRPKKWGTLKIDGKDVKIPQAGSEDSSVQSSFHHDELLVYNEAQVRLRYVITVKL